MNTRGSSAVLVAAVLGLAGCGGSEPASQPSVPVTTSTTSPTPSATPTPTPKPSATPTPTPKPIQPVDGRNLRACADRVCAVSVKAGDTIYFGPRVKMKELTVLAIRKNKLQLHIYDDQGGVSVDIGGRGSFDIADVHADVEPAKGSRYVMALKPRK